MQNVSPLMVTADSSLSRSDGLVIVCISDTHELHEELSVPNGDLLIHAGDFTFFGKSTQAISRFNDWLGTLPHRHKVCVCGNHEYMFQSNPGLARLITNATLLNNESTTVGGLKIWGSPLTQHFGSTFGRSNAADRVRVYNTIPEGTDIIITHGPPYGILDGSPNEYPGPSGDRELREAIVRVRPRLHTFGHIHTGYGVRATRHTLFVNAALMGLDGTLDKRAIVLRMSVTKSN